MSNIQHGQKIITESYYDGKVASRKEQNVVSIISSKENMLKDIIDCLGVINKGETTKLEVEVCIDSKGRYMIKKKWRLI